MTLNPYPGQYDVILLMTIHFKNCNRFWKRWTFMCAWGSYVQRLCAWWGKRTDGCSISWKGEMEDSTGTTREPIIMVLEGDGTSFWVLLKQAEESKSASRGQLVFIGPK